MRCLMLILLTMILAGCRTFEIGLVQTPTLDRPMATPTISLLPTATVTIEQPTVEPTSTATITPTVTKRPASNPIVPTATATPQPQGPAILEFSVEPLEVDPGAAVTVRWSVTNATSIDIYQRVPDTLPVYNTVNLSASGQLTQ